MNTSFKLCPVFLVRTKYLRTRTRATFTFDAALGVNYYFKMEMVTTLSLCVSFYFTGLGPRMSGMKVTLGGQFAWCN